MSEFAHMAHKHSYGIACFQRKIKKDGYLGRLKLLCVRRALSYGLFDLFYFKLKNFEEISEKMQIMELSELKSMRKCISFYQYSKQFSAFLPPKFPPKNILQMIDGVYPKSYDDEDTETDDSDVSSSSVFTEMKKIAKYLIKNNIAKQTAGVWEAPKGKKMPKEEPIIGAFRELAEETGLISSNIIRIIPDEPIVLTFTVNYKKYTWTYFVALIDPIFKLSKTHHSIEDDKISIKTEDTIKKITKASKERSVEQLRFVFEKGKAIIDSLG